MSAWKDRFRGLTAPLVRVAGPLQARARTLLEGLTPRDRMLLYLLVIAGTTALVVLGGLGLRGNLDRLQGEIDTRKGQLSMVQEMQREWRDGQATLGQLEEKVTAHAATSFSAFLEKCADRVAIRDNLKQVKELSTATTDTLEERQYAVTVSRVTLDQLVGFLYEVETAGYPLRVLSTKIKTAVVGGQSLLDVTLEISSFRLIEASPGGDEP
jgi:hypothetical protein